MTALSPPAALAGDRLDWRITARDAGRTEGARDQTVVRSAATRVARSRSGNVVNRTSRSALQDPSMRRATCLFLIALLAGPAAAQTAKPMTVIPQAPAAATAQTPAPALPPPLIPLTGSSQNRDPAQCRSSCDRAYYFCIAGGDNDACPTQWSQCKVSCTATYTPPRRGN
jgi:hypothetical protein